MYSKDGWHSVALFGIRIDILLKLTCYFLRQVSHRELSLDGITILLALGNVVQDLHIWTELVFLCAIRFELHLNLFSSAIQYINCSSHGTSTRKRRAMCLWILLLLSNRPIAGSWIKGESKEGQKIGLSFINANQLSDYIYYLLIILSNWHILIGTFQEIFNLCLSWVVMS